MKDPVTIPSRHTHTQSHTNLLQYTHTHTHIMRVEKCDIHGFNSVLFSLASHNYNSFSVFKKGILVSDLVNELEKIKATKTLY